MLLKKSFDGRARAHLRSGEAWTDHVARLSLPLFIAAAKHGGRIFSYTQLADALKREFKEPIKPRKTLYGRPAGKIGDALRMLSEDWGEEIPPINALMVDQATRIPGDGAYSFVQRYLHERVRSKLSKEDKEALARQAMSAVAEYPDWNRVARYFDVRDLQPPPPLDLNDDQPIRHPKGVGLGGGAPESTEHLALKAWLKKNPKVLNRYGDFGPGHTEERLFSADKVDVVFRSRVKVVACEVKASNAPSAEVFRGIYQCVKYRSVLRAMQIAAGEVPNALALLVTSASVSSEVTRLARRLQVPIIQVKQP